MFYFIKQSALIILIPAFAMHLMSMQCHIDTYSEGDMIHLLDNDFVKVWNKTLDTLSFVLMILGIAMVTYDFWLK